MRPGSDVIDPAPPRSRDGGGDGGGGWAWLVTASGIMEAELIRGLLGTAGIVDVVFDERNPSPGAWLFPSGNVKALVRLFVPKPLLQDARLVMLEASIHVQQPARAPERGWRWKVWIAITVVLVALFLWATLNVLRIP